MAIKKSDPKLNIIKFIFTASLGLLIFRLWYLQLLNGEYYRNLSQNNKTRRIAINAPRGDIYDNGGRVLVKNRISYNVGLILEDIKNRDQVLQTLSEISLQGFQDLSDQLNLEIKKTRAFELKTILKDIDFKLLARVKANLFRLPGVIITTDPVREYMQRDIGSQVLGYVRKITSEHLKLQKFIDYNSNDKIGHAGIENYWEKSLKGEKGYLLLEVDAVGKRQGEVKRQQPLKGKSLYLTLDMDLQAMAHAQLGDRKGVVLAINPQNGKILSMVSTPSVDSNIFSSTMSSNIWKKITSDQQKPMLNRAISAHYPPGSTIKPFFSAIGLNEGVLDIDSKERCHGFWNFKGRNYHCHRRSGHGAVGIRESIERSCNVFYYKLGNKLGIDKISSFGNSVYWGETIGIDLPRERHGILPSRSWKKEVVGERWYPGDTISVSIGQGFLSLTPLELATSLSALASGGNLYKPYLVEKIIDNTTGEEEIIEPIKLSKLSFKEEHLNEVIQGAIDVVNSPRGSGKRAALKSIKVAGKTGTAQVVSLGSSKSDSLKDHGWFVSFAPAENPQIVVVVLVENAGSGGKFAAPIAKEILRVFFAKKKMLTPEDLTVEVLK